MAVAFSPDGKTVAHGGAATGRRGSGTPPTARPIGRPSRHTRVAVGRRGLQPRRQGRPHGSTDGTARLWDAADGTPIGPPLKHAASSRPWPSAPTARPSSRGATTGRRGSGALPTARAIGQPCEHMGSVMRRGLQPRRQGRRSRRATTARRGSGTRRRHAHRPALMRHEGPVMAVAFSPDGKAVLTASDDGTARLWDAADGTPIGQPLEAPGTPSGPWPSAPTARPSSREARRHGAALGRRRRHAHRPALGATGRRHGRGLQPRRQGRPHGERTTGRRGSGTPPTARPSAGP